MSLEIRGDISRLRLAPGDVIVLRFPGRLPMQDVARIRETMEAQFPGHRCIVLENGAELAVLSKSPPAPEF